MSAQADKSRRKAGGIPRAADRIRASARELFYREGIRAVGVDEIVHRAGVTKPSLYRSFASKDELAAAYLRDYDRDFWERFERPHGKTYADPRQQVLAYIAELAGGRSGAAIAAAGSATPRSNIRRLTIPPARWRKRTRKRCASV